MFLLGTRPSVRCRFHASPRPLLFADEEAKRGLTVLARILELVWGRAVINLGPSVSKAHCTFCAGGLHISGAGLFWRRAVEQKGRVGQRI